MIKTGDIITIKPQWQDADNARFLAGKGEVTIATIVR